MRLKAAQIYYNSLNSGFIDFKNSSKLIISWIFTTVFLITNAFRYLNFDAFFLNIFENSLK